MKNKLLLLLFLLLLCNCSLAQLSQKQVNRALFIGNSITEENSLPYLFRKLCKANNIRFYTDEIIYPAASISEQFYKKLSEEKGFLKINELKTGELSPVQLKIQKYNWDVVILQGADPIDYKNLKAIIAIDSICTKKSIKKVFRFEMYNVILFDSTERKRGLIDWEKTVIPTLSTTNCKLLPIGRLFDKSNNLFPDLELFPDNCHPSFAGSIIIASSLFYELYGIMPDITCFNKDLTDQNITAIINLLVYYYHAK